MACAAAGLVAALPASCEACAAEVWGAAPDGEAAIDSIPFGVAEADGEIG